MNKTTKSLLDTLYSAELRERVAADKNYASFAERKQAISSAVLEVIRVKTEIAPTLAKRGLFI